MNDEQVLALGEKRARELCLITHWLESRGGMTGGYYLADDIHRLLGSGEVRFGYIGGEGYYRGRMDGEIQCLCIGIKPIKQESEERKLLREIAQFWEKWNSAFVGSEYHNKIRELLEEEGK